MIAPSASAIAVTRRRDDRERVGVRVQVAADAHREPGGAQRRQLGGRVAELGERRRLVAGGEQARGEREAPRGSAARAPRARARAAAGSCAGDRLGLAAREPRQPRGDLRPPAVAARRRVEHRCRRRACRAARPSARRRGRRRAASSGCSRRSCQRPSPSATSRAGDVARAVVDLDARAVPARRAARSAQSRMSAGATAAPAASRTSPRAHVAQRDAAEVHRDALAGAGARHRRVVDLHARARAPRARRAAARACRPRAIAPAQSVPGHDRPGAADRERPVDVQDGRGGRARAGPPGEPGGDVVQRRRDGRRRPRPSAPSTRRPRRSPAAARRPPPRRRPDRRGRPS